MRERRKFQPLTSSNVCQIYELLHKEGLVAFPITEDARKKIDALVASITSAYFGAHIYATPELKAVAYLYFIFKNHPFTDGNKRTASLAFETVCKINKLKTKYSVWSITLDQIVVFIEKVRERDHQKVITKLARLIFGNNG